MEHRVPHAEGGVQIPHGRGAAQPEAASEAGHVQADAPDQVVQAAHRALPPHARHRRRGGS